MISASLSHKHDRVPVRPLRHLLHALLFASLAGSAAGALAQQAPAGYPNKPVRVVLTSAPGGGLNVVTRLVLDKMSQRSNITFVADSQAGAAGVIAMRIVNDAPPDGYTLLSSSNTFIINGAMKAVPFDIRTAYVPVVRMTTQPYMTYVNVSVPANNFRELIAYAKANPNKLNLGSTGTGTVPHLGLEMINAAAGVQITHVPYKGIATANLDLVGDRIQILFGSVSGNQLVKTGKVKLIAVMSLKRMPMFPDVPTVAESGFPDFELTNTYTVVAPGKTPPAIVAYLNKELAQTVNLPEMKEKFAADFSDASPPYGPEELKKMYIAEFDKWEKVVKAANIKPEQ